MDITKEVFKHHRISFDSPHFFGFWELGYSFVKIKDSDYSFTDLCGDTYCPEVNNDIDPAQLKREKEAFVRRVKKEGVYGCGLALNGDLIHAFMVWGFVGNDYLGSGYDSEHLSELLDRAKLGHNLSKYKQDQAGYKLGDLLNVDKQLNIKLLSLREMTEKAKLLDCVDTLDLSAIRSELLTDVLTDVLTHVAASGDTDMSAFAVNILKTHSQYLTPSGAWEAEHQ